MDIAGALLNIPSKDESIDEVSPSRAAYRKLLADTLLQGRTRIFSFSNRPRTPPKPSFDPPTLTKIQPARKRRNIPQLRSLDGIHHGPVGSLAWNNDHVLTTGGALGEIINNYIRIQSHGVRSYRGHGDAISAPFLLTGSTTTLRLSERSLGVPSRIIYWHQVGLNPIYNCIKFWNVSAGTCLKSVETGSQVCGLLWSKNEHELLSSHGPEKNQIALWKYPSMTKIAELTGHTSYVLYMTHIYR
ncbi:hypothetical protein LUZ61_004642 [Rhynchospora tenuis]|uniref:Uncharacterized protein n=1 Tax=Rhynchospora tenuis TaxID=198213 RepID=A0AAD5ZN34_9POAL|nr:hypothetical protein LUZ61_004642 [Rhynchospora tenuis]